MRPTRNSRPAHRLVAVAALTLAASAVLAQGRVPRTPYPEQLRPDDQPPLPEDFAITRKLGVDPKSQVRSAPDPAEVNLPRDIPARISACWAPPQVDENQILQVTVRMSFRADGSVIGAPVTPFLNAPNDDARRALKASLLSAIRACTPLRFTPSLGRAIAGRIFAIRYVVHHVSHDQRT